MRLNFLSTTLCDVPALAVSLCAYGRGLDYSGAASLAVSYGDKILKRGLPRDTLLNVNVPLGATLETARVVCKLGRRNYLRRITESRDPRGRPYYWIGGGEIDFDDLPGSDCNVIASGKVSVTPLQVDMTRHRFLEELGRW